MPINKQAKVLNAIISMTNPVLWELLSRKGRAIYFPQQGIISQSAEAKGKKIDATIGIATEDDGTPMRLGSIAKLIKLAPNEVFSYASSYGRPELRKLWQELIYKKNLALKGTISTPVVTVAVNQGLSIIGYLFVNPGEEIILPDKFWENYKLIFANGYGGKLATFPTFAGRQFNTVGLKKKLSERQGKKILLLNFPNNPSGYTPTKKEAAVIIQIIKQRAAKGDKILVICDDAYFGLVYKEAVIRESLFAVLANLHKNVLAIKVDGATKEEYAWGLRVGFITYGCQGITEEVCRALEAKTAGAIRGNTSNAPNISQSLIMAGLASPAHSQEKAKKFAILHSRFKKVEEALKNKVYQKYFHPLPCNSGYFVCLELAPGLNAEKVRKLLLEKYDTGVIADANLLRLAFSSVQKSLIKKLFGNIYQACKELDTL